MKKIISKFKIYIIFLFIVLISSFLLSFFNILGMSNTISKILSIIIISTTYLVVGFINGKNANSKGYIQGFKTGILLTMLLFILSLFSFNFNTKTIIYYGILIILSTIGSTIGINKK